MKYSSQSHRTNDNRKCTLRVYVTHCTSYEWFGLFSRSHAHTWIHLCQTHWILWAYSKQMKVRRLLPVSSSRHKNVLSRAVRPMCCVKTDNSNQISFNSFESLLQTPITIGDWIDLNVEYIIYWIWDTFEKLRTQTYTHTLWKHL